MGRHSRPTIPAKECFCASCSSQLDDEIVKSVSFREEGLTALFRNCQIFSLNSNSKFLEIMNSDNMEVLVAVGKLICYAENESFFRFF